MNREQFLSELEELLQELTAEEREEALRYYRDLFAEAGPDGEAEILRRLGRPEKVAAEILDGLRGGADAGEFTERGYQDERFDDERLVPERRVRSREGRRDGVLLLVLFLVFGLPLVGTILSAGFSLAAGLLGGGLGIVAGLIGLIFGGVVLALGLLVSGIVMVFVGIFNLMSPADGLMFMCLGFLMLSASMLAAVAAKWGCTSAVPGVIRFCCSAVRRICACAAGVVRRVFGRGGAAA